MKNKVSKIDEEVLTEGLKVHVSHSPRKCYISKLEENKAV